MEERNEWDENELKTIQNLSTYLGISILGIKPKERRTSSDLAKFPYLPDLENELFLRNNLAFAQIAILSGLVHMDTQTKERILATSDINGFRKKSFERYLFELMAREYSNTGKVDIDTIQEKIPDYVPVIYGEPTSNRTLYGTYYNWALILKLHPTRSQVSRAIELVNRQVSDIGEEQSSS